MKKWMAAGLLCSFALVSCQSTTTTESQRERDRQEQEKTDEAARKAGRAAYEATQEAKHAAKELGRDLKSASAQAQKGWDEAKHEHQEKKATGQH
jgi:hypothetical protein